MIKRDKQIALMRIASERVDSPLHIWMADPRVQAILDLDPEEIAANPEEQAVPKVDCCKMMLACA